MKKVFVLLWMSFSFNTVFSQTIVKAEYFLDAYQGQGNGIAVPNFTQGDIVNFPLTIPTAQLSSGFHFLNIRVADANGVWSQYETRVFYLSTTSTTISANITGAEYFIGADPGAGGGIPINIGSSGSVVSFPVSIPAPLSSGFHSLSIRVKDQEGKWSLFEQRSFYIAPGSIAASPIVAAEYFYDVDPGFGSASPLTVAIPGDIITQTFLVPVPNTLSQGDHVLSIRVKDQEGHWSFYEKDTITVGAVSGSITCPGNVVVSAPAGQCSAIVNSIDPTVSPVGTSYTYTLTGATVGTGNGTASGKTFNAGVTTVTYALNNSTSTNCSFTVTVNSDVTPTVNINPSGTEICPGQQVVFTTIQFNGGATPSYQWKLNGNNIPGATNSTYQSTSLANGDIVSVSMTSSLGCANPQIVLSNTILINVSSSVVPSVSLGISATTICTGTPVNFIAIPTNGGISPTYQWKLNGNIIPGVTGSAYQSSTLVNGDHVTVTMTSSLACANPQTATITGFTMTVTPTLPPFVYLESSSTTICAGTTATFYANPTNGGTNPSYQWKVNGNNVGNVSDTYSSPSLNNGDIVTVVMTSSLGCASPQAATSSPITMTVLPSSPASVNINASSTTICSGTNVTFNVTPVTAGAGYQWQLNGNNIPGATGTTYQSSSLQNGDKIKVMSTQSSQCFSTSSVASNEITISVNAAATPSVLVDASATTTCAYQMVTFTATPVNAGSNITYEWTLNNIVVGSNSPVYQTDWLATGDKIKVSMSSQVCGTYSQIVSNIITMTINSPVAPQVTIVAEHNPVCVGAIAKFTANPVNGGDNPSYQWKVNGSNVGGDSAIFQSDSLHDGDIIYVEMTSSLLCVQAQTVPSNVQFVYIDTIRTYYRDRDGDWYGNPDSTIRACEIDENSGWVITGGDCNDNNASIHPEATEICGNGIDDDCDGQTDEACGSPDNDGDGYTIAQGDCNDNNATIHPGATEICSNGIDDNCNGQTDENCTEDLPVLILKTYPAKEGDVGYTTVDIEVRLDRPAVSAVRLNYATSNDDAIAGSDYVAANGVLIIPPGSSSGTIQIKVIGDLLKESNERFWLNFTNPVNVVLPDDPRCRIMIIDNDKGKVTTTAVNNEQVPIREEIFKIPTVTKRNQVWVIPQIGNYENEVLIVNVQGQVVSRFVNYRNQTALGNVSTGLYFYRIKIMESPGQYKYYSGRLLITE